MHGAELNPGPLNHIFVPFIASLIHPIPTQPHFLTCLYYLAPKSLARLITNRLSFARPNPDADRLDVQSLFSLQPGNETPPLAGLAT
jgi:hypothetical protein